MQCDASWDLHSLVCEMNSWSHGLKNCQMAHQASPNPQFRDHVAFRLVGTARAFFDKISGYEPDKPMSAEKWLDRFIYLETVAAIPGMVAGALRHLQSLRLMRRDNGWIHTLLEEAENERMHLLTFIKVRGAWHRRRQPSGSGCAIAHTDTPNADSSFHLLPPLCGGASVADEAPGRALPLRRHPHPGGRLQPLLPLLCASSPAAAASPPAARADPVVSHCLC